MTLPGAVREGYMSYLRVYPGEDLGGPPRKKFVRSCDRALRKAMTELIPQSRSQPMGVRVPSRCQIVGMAKTALKRKAF